MADKVKKGDRVKIEYTGKMADGEVFDSSKGREPLSFEVGSGKVIPGFDKAVEGMELNEEKTVTIKSEDAYGPVRKEAVQEFPRDKLPKDPEPKEGMMLILTAPDGRQIPAKIAKVEKDKVSVDLNHPLAGKDLTFEIKIVGINEPEEKKEEKAEQKEGEPNEGGAENKEKQNESSSPEDEESGCSSCDSCPGCH
jgi:FKBP-type peptidyl-prolyl cis-trans isomerase 2